MAKDFNIVPNEDWRRGGCWKLLADGVPVMVNDSKEVLSVYAGLLAAEEQRRSK